MLLGTSSAASAFAGGERVNLHKTRIIVDAKVKAWRTKIEVFAGKTQREIEQTDDEAAVTAAVDCDQLKMSIGKQLETCDQLTTTDPLDKHRNAKYINRLRATFKKYGFLTDQDAKDNIDMQQCCILPSEDYIMNRCRVQEKLGLSDITIASSGEAQDDNRCNMGTDPNIPAPTTGQD